MDLNENGSVSMREMVHFLDNVYRAAGAQRSMSRIVKDVEAIFASLNKPISDGMSWEEFQHTTHTVRVITGETLVDLFDVITQNFTSALHEDSPKPAAAPKESLRGASSDFGRSMTAPK
jgi:hypothetical protein